MLAMCAILSTVGEWKAWQAWGRLIVARVQRSGTRGLRRCDHPGLRCAAPGLRCWSYSKGWDGEPDFYSFAAITDEPPPEVIAAGHDRCIVPIKPENVDAWLNPETRNLAKLYAILDDRDRPYYEHCLAA
jgi:hypothetical protein